MATSGAARDAGRGRDKPGREVLALAGSSPSGRRRSLAAPVRRLRRAPPARRLAAQRSLHATRQRADATLDALACRRLRRLLRQLRDLALQLAVLLDQLGHHRVELTDDVAAAGACATGPAGLPTRGGAPAARPALR